MKESKFIKLTWLFTLALLAACQPAWTIHFKSDRLTTTLSKKEFQGLREEYTETGNCEGLPLNVVLYRSGYEVIDSVTLNTTDGSKTEIDWAEKGEEGCLNENGRISFDTQQYNTKEIVINEETFDPEIIRITDIAPTVLTALDIYKDNLPGKSLTKIGFKHVVLVYFDGFGYAKFEQALRDGLLINLAKVQRIEKALTVYPPRTTFASAAVMTGLPPAQNGVYETGIRKTEAETIFDLVSEARLKSIAVEGGSLAFNMRNTEVVLSGDRDQNGSTDDNVLANTDEVIKTRMPDLLWIHFHGIDDAGHTYGPGSQQVDEKIFEIDAFFGKILASLPESTIIIGFADHGMHPVNEEGRSGNHGNLIYSDMVIPVIVEIK